MSLIFCGFAARGAGERGLCRPETADVTKNADLKAMVGNWKVNKAELGGKDLTDALKDLKFEVREGGKYTAQFGEEKDEGAFTIDPTKTPKEVDIKGNGGPNKES